MTRDPAPRPRLVIVEGIMGSGKTTTVLRTAEKLNSSGIAAVGITEGVSPHPVRHDWYDAWEDVNPRDLASAQVEKWRAYVSGMAADDRVHLIDGQLFHGNLTAMFLLEADPDLIAGFCRNVCAVIAPCDPLLIYFRQDDVAAAIHTISAERGPAWVDYQTNWKLSSPYAGRRGLTGLDGLVAVYREYRALTDRLFTSLKIPKLRIDNTSGHWPEYYRLIDQAMLHAPH